MLSYRRWVGRMDRLPLKACALRFVLGSDRRKGKRKKGKLTRRTKHCGFDGGEDLELCGDGGDSLADLQQSLNREKGEGHRPCAS